MSIERKYLEGMSLAEELAYHAEFIADSMYEDEPDDYVLTNDSGYPTLGRHLNYMGDLMKRAADRIRALEAENGALRKPWASGGMIIRDNEIRPRSDG